MNKKGYTLIELLAAILLIALITVTIVPNVLTAVDASKQKSYDIMIKNTITASKLYYEECEYGDLSDKDKYGSYACKIVNNTIDTNLGALANTGFLKGKYIKDKNTKIIEDPRNNKDIGTCGITIVKTKDKNGKVTYNITSNGGSDCPKEYGSVN